MVSLIDIYGISDIDPSLNVPWEILQKMQMYEFLKTIG